MITPMAAVFLLKLSGARPAVTMCPVCSTPVARKYRYCPQCGGSLNGDADKPAAGAPVRDARAIQHRPKLRTVRMSTENKQVSVLFVDVCDSTTLLQHADPEASRTILATLSTCWSTRSKPLAVPLANCSGRSCRTVRRPGCAGRSRPASLHGRTQDAKGIHPEYEACGLPVRHSASGSIPARCWSALSAVPMVTLWRRRPDHTYCVALEKMAPPGGIWLTGATQRLVAQQIDTRPVGVRSVRD